MTFGSGRGFEILPGYEVYTEDGTRIGLVSEVSEADFKLDETTQQHAPWLSYSHVVAVADKQVTLDVTESQLEEVFGGTTQQPGI